jgi:subtilase family serine protease
MEKIISFLTATVFSIIVFCQNPQLPPGSNPGQLPVPKVKQLDPPDLRVEELSLVSIVRDEAAKKLNIQVLIRIKNFGGISSGVSTAVAYIKSPSGTGATKALAITLSVEAINPGASFVKVFTFREGEVFFKPGAFDFWIKADARNAVTESNETNNTSTVINIALPAR